GRGPSRATLFPYTTLFRSWRSLHRVLVTVAPPQCVEAREGACPRRRTGPELARLDLGVSKPRVPGDPADQAGDLAGSQVKVLQRSEEHTSELQSRENLVCR